jgi:uncharacterized membrane-anchored protein YjiN (DUF445 family)
MSGSRDLSLMARGPIKVPEVSQIAEPESNSAEAKLADLRRMRAIALGLLGLMACIFVASSAAKVDWPWLPYVRAFAEAGMVGACADWFAVVALFRHPFGLPIPHTGIVPNNKDRIGSALGRFITNNFLTPRVAHEQLVRVDVVRWIAHWINDPENSRRLVQYVGALLPRILTSLSRPEFGEWLGHLARRGAESVPAAPLASKILAALWAGGAAQPALERALDLGERSLKRHKPTIDRIVSEHSYRWIPKWVDKMIAERVMAGLLSTMEELRDPSHPWRVELVQSVEKLITDLATDAEMYALGERMKAELLANPLFQEQAKSMWMEIENGLQSDMRARVEAFARAFEVGLHSFGKWLDENQDRQQRLNRWIRLIMLRILLPRRAEIGAYVTQVVHNWDSDTLVQRLELQVGKDLQYIRINGTLVGGLVGVLIFTFSRWVFAP